MPFLTTAALALAFTPVQDWPQFRGPGGLALADEAPIPTDFGPEQRVLWKTKVPSGHSSPCLVGSRLYLTGFDAGADVVLALDKKDGTVLWSKRFQGERQRELGHPDTGPALATIAADEQRVIAYFGNYGLVALDPAGELLWEKRLKQPRHVFGVGTSPVLIGDVVVLARDGAAEGAILAFDASDGREAWRIERLGFGQAYSTPFLWRNAERVELVLGGNATLCSYDPGSGKELWRVENTTAFPCTTPTADQDTLYFAAWSTPNATGRSFWDSVFDRSLDLTDEEVGDPAKIFARLDLDGDGKVTREELPECRAKDSFGTLDGDKSGAWERAEFLGRPPPEAAGRNVLVAVARGAQGDATRAHVRWSWERGLPYVSSPLLYEQRLWLFQSGGLVSVLDAQSGKPLVDRERLSDRGEYYVSPVGAAGHVLVGSAEGTFYVFSATAPELTLEHSVTFDEGFYATPAVVGGVIYLRTPTTQWAFGLAK